MDHNVSIRKESSVFFVADWIQLLERYTAALSSGLQKAMHRFLPYLYLCYREKVAITSLRGYYAVDGTPPSYYVFTF